MAKKKIRKAVRKTAGRPRKKTVRPPAAAVIPAAVPEALKAASTEERLNLWETLKNSWEIFIKNIKFVWIPAVIINLPFIFLARIDFKDMQHADWRAILYAFAAFGFIALFFNTVIYRIYEGKENKHPAAYAFSRFLPVMGVGILYMAILCAIFLPAVFAFLIMKNTVAGILIALLIAFILLVPLFYVSVGFTFAGIIAMLEPETDNPFARSMKIIKGNFWMVFLGTLVMAGINQAMNLVFSPIGLLVRLFDGNITEFGAQMISACIYSPIYTPFYMAFIFAMYKALKNKV